MKNKIKLYNMYAAWDYEKEIEQLNKNSKKGWQLIHGGCFYSTYERDTEIYRYQIDYNRAIDDKIRYIELFKEQGWEYINSTWNGWHYFRKKYDKELPEEEYIIYTDKESKKEMANRWSNFAIIITMIGGIFFLIYLFNIINRPRLRDIGFILEFIAIFFTMLTGIYQMKISPISNKSRRKFPIRFALVMIIIGCLWFILFPDYQIQRDGNQTIIITQENNDGWESSFEIKGMDFYYLDLNIESEAFLTFSIVNSKDEIVYGVSGNQIKVNNKKFFFKKGNYKFLLQYHEEKESIVGKKVKFNFRFGY